jgi:hypothetical protein
MPQNRKIFMNLTNTNHISIRMNSQAKVAKVAEKSRSLAGLQNSMIQRIHNIKPGCGSCGK